MNTFTDFVSYIKSILGIANHKKAGFVAVFSLISGSGKLVIHLLGTYKTKEEAMKFLRTNPEHFKFCSQQQGYAIIPTKNYITVYDYYKPQNQKVSVVNYDLTISLTVDKNLCSQLGFKVV